MQNAWCHVTGRSQTLDTWVRNKWAPLSRREDHHALGCWGCLTTTSLNAACGLWASKISGWVEPPLSLIPLYWEPQRLAWPDPFGYDPVTSAWHLGSRVSRAKPVKTPTQFSTHKTRRPTQSWPSPSCRCRPVPASCASLRDPPQSFMDMVLGV